MSAVVSTGQHKELILPLEQYFGITPDADLKLMVSGQSLSDLFTRAESTMQHVLQESRPNLVIVQGDTTTAMATSMAAFHAGVHVVHVEAGLRTGDFSAPYPEEFNRKIIGILCSVCFAPTDVAERALLHEGVKKVRVHQVGNTVVDALEYTKIRPPLEVEENDGVRLKSLVDRIDGETSIFLPIKTKYLLEKRQTIVLVTIHRRENAASGAFHRFASGTESEIFNNIP